MAVEKMELVSIFGPIKEFDRLVMHYIGGKNIHLENVFDLTDIEEVKSYSFNNPYEDLMKNVSDTIKYTEISTLEQPKQPLLEMSPDEIQNFSKAINKTLLSMKSKSKELLEEIEENNKVIKQLDAIKNVDIKLSNLFDFEHIKVRFGKIPKDSITLLDAYLKEYTVFFFKFGEDKEFVYGFYFVPTVMREKIDNLFTSLFFQRVRITKIDGTPMQIITQLQLENKKLQDKVNRVENDMKLIIEKEQAKVLNTYFCAKRLYDSYNARKYAGHTMDSFFVAGWMPKGMASPLKHELKNEPNITTLIEAPENVKKVMPPTKLKNFLLFRPFEKFVEMYALPAYNELDPTFIFAITYSLMFGIMYGDVGHGLILTLIGFLMARKKNFLGPILETCGVVAIIFGFLYGSVFGYEEIVPTLWYKPMQDSSTMSATLIMAVAIGVVLISASMVLNIINGMKQKDIGKILFDSNGIAGFVFYWAIIIGVLSVLRGNSILTAWYIAIFVVLPLILVFFKEPLTHLLQKRKEWMPENKVMFVVETFFEMFELLLSYVTNTISFIRVGAFALNHAGMLTVVFTIAKTLSGVSSLAIIIIGNAIVIGLEGLLVAIQVLRLQYYEMFSRYFVGTGRPFKKFD